MPTEDEIEHVRWHQEFTKQEKRTRVATRKREHFIDSEAQAKTDWTPISVPGNAKGGPETQVAWFAHNRATKQSVEFGSFEEARDFCFHPDNERQVFSETEAGGNTCELGPRSVTVNPSDC